MMEESVFSGKSLANVFEDIYKNTETKRTQINEFLIKLVRMVRTPEEAAVLSPVIKDFMEVAVRNDEHIVKVAQIAQRAISVGAKASGGNEFITEEEKRQLIKNLQGEVDEIQEEAQEIEDELESMKSNV